MAVEEMKSEDDVPKGKDDERMQIATALSKFRAPPKKEEAPATAVPSIRDKLRQAFKRGATMAPKLTREDSDLPTHRTMLRQTTEDDPVTEDWKINIGEGPPKIASLFGGNNKGPGDLKLKNPPPDEESKISWQDQSQSSKEGPEETGQPVATPALGQLLKPKPTETPAKEESPQAPLHDLLSPAQPEGLPE